MLNKVMLIGNLGKAPEVRHTPSGQVVGTFSLATSRRWRNDNGDLQESTEWHQVVCWGRRAEIAREYLAKGQRLYVEGRLQTRSWEDPETGKKQYRTEIGQSRFR